MEKAGLGCNYVSTKELIKIRFRISSSLSLLNTQKILNSPNEWSP